MGRMTVERSTTSSIGKTRLAVTLIELLVVLGIIALVLGITVPGMAGYAQRLRLNTSARELVQMLSLARSMAISSHAEHAVEIDQDAGEIRVVNDASHEALERVMRLPDAVTVSMEVGGEPATESRVVFHPSGSLNGRSVSLMLADPREHRTIVVSGTTGSAALSKEGQ